MEIKNFEIKNQNETVEEVKQAFRSAVERKAFKPKKGVYFTSLEAARNFLTPKRIELLHVIKERLPQNKNLKLTRYEKKVLKAVESGRWKSIPRLKGRIQQLKKYAREDIKKMKLTSDYHKDLLKRLKNMDYALGYLNDCAEDEDPGVLLLGIKHVAEAHGVLKRFTIKGYPRLGRLVQMTNAMGMQIMFAPKKKVPRRHPHV